MHHDRDSRGLIGQRGHELFSALQRQGVRSKFVNFPDEGHWALTPANSQFWHKHVFEWFKTHGHPSASRAGVICGIYYDSGSSAGCSDYTTPILPPRSARLWCGFFRASRLTRP
jgi:hypothetical protein